MHISLTHTHARTHACMRSRSRARTHAPAHTHKPTDCGHQTPGLQRVCAALQRVVTVLQHIDYFGGHRHNTDQTTTASIAPNNNWLVGGGGGWGCDGRQQVCCGTGMLCGRCTVVGVLQHCMPGVQSACSRTTLRCNMLYCVARCCPVVTCSTQWSCNMLCRVMLNHIAQGYLLQHATNLVYG